MEDVKYSEPYADGFLVDGIFGEYGEEVRKKCMKDGKLKKGYSTQRKVLEKFPGNDSRSRVLREGLMHLLDNVLFVPEPHRKGYWHQRLAAK